MKPILENGGQALILNDRNWPFCDFRRDAILALRTAALRKAVGLTI